MGNVRKSVLVVDDIPENARILAEILQSDYVVKAAMSGEKALAICDKGGIDLVLLDVMMPEMDGFAVLKALKSQTKTKDIPVVFVTSKDDVVDEAEGLLLGAIDYIRKPVTAITAKARVANHLALATSQKELKGLLSSTLTGTVRLLTDLLSLSNPDIFSKASALKTQMGEIVRKLGLRNTWEYELAALLSQIGCVTMDPELLRKVNEGKTLSDAEEESFNQYFNVSAALLSHIPRLERIKDMLQNVNMGINRALTKESIQTHDPVDVGRRLLKVMFTYSRLIGRKLNVRQILKILADAPETYDRFLVQTLADLVSNQSSVFEEDLVTADNLRIGMILRQDIHTKTGQFLLARGTEVSAVLIKKLESFVSTGRIKDEIPILIRR